MTTPTPSELLVIDLGDVYDCYFVHESLNFPVGSFVVRILPPPGQEFNGPGHADPLGLHQQLRFGHGELSDSSGHRFADAGYRLLGHSTAEPNNEPIQNGHFIRRDKDGNQIPE